VREPRSIIFYAWAGLAVQSVLTAAVIAFVLFGAAYQHSAIENLRSRVQAVQVANLALLADFLDAQRAARGYQATRQPALRQAYRAQRDRVEREFGRVERLAWTAVRGDVLAEGGIARSAFLADDRAMLAPVGSSAAARLYAQAAASTGTFIGRAGSLRLRLGRDGDVLAARGERILGVGLGWTGAILAVGLMLPVIVVAVGLRWVNGPLHTVTTAVRRRSLGDNDARAVPGGPADVRELASSLNYLADESDRARAGEQERARLLAEVRQASVRIREHLRGEAIIREAVTAIHDHLAVDFVWVGIVTGERLTLAEGKPDAWGQVTDIVGHFPPDAVGWIRDIYRHRSSYRVQDLPAAQAEDIPAEIKKILLSHGATSLLLTPFGAGQELLGCLTLLRTSHGRVWTQPEIEAVESLAADIGRGLEHARLYEAEERLVTELKSLDLAKANFLASASHDLRTPLTSIIGYVELLSDREAGPVLPVQARMLDGVGRNARRLKTMIEDMLTMSKIELGAFTSQLHPVDLASLVPPGVDVIRPSAAAGGLALEVNCPDHTVTIDGDPEQLDRVLVNLLSNAVKYTPRGGRITVTVDSAGGSAVLSVTDTGMGIPQEDQKGLFTRFFRASNAVEAAIPGSGLGLSIVHTIVANHHGELAVESARDQGTTITVRFPLHDGTAPAGAAASLPSGPRGYRGAPVPPARVRASWSHTWQPPQWAHFHRRQCRQRSSSVMSLPGLVSADPTCSATGPPGIPAAGARRQPLLELPPPALRYRRAGGPVAGDAGDVRARPPGREPGRRTARTGVPAPRCRRRE
jgi:signal transduction histidine kinase